MKQWRIGILGVVVSAAAILLFISQVNMQAFLQALAQAQITPILACMLLLLAGLFLRAWRWRALLDGGLDYWPAFNIMNIAYLVNNLLPFRIGEVARMYLATQAEPPVPAFKTLGSVVTERLLDLLAVVLLTTLALAAGPVPNELRIAGAGGAVTALGGFLLLVFFASRRALAQRVLGWFSEKITLLHRLQVTERANHFLDGAAPLTDARKLARVLLLTVLSWGISVAAGYILMFAFFPFRGTMQQIAATCLYIASAAFAIAVPAVPGNLGTYELSILLALNAFGYGGSVDTAAAFAVVVHGVNLVVHVGAGIVGFIQQGISLERLSQGVQQMRQQSS